MSTKIEVDRTIGPLSSFNRFNRNRIGVVEQKCVFNSPTPYRVSPDPAPINALISGIVLIS